MIACVCPQLATQPRPLNTKKVLASSIYKASCRTSVSTKWGYHPAQCHLRGVNRQHTVFCSKSTVHVFCFFLRARRECFCKVSVFCCPWFIGLVFHFFVIFQSICSSSFADKLFLDRGPALDIRRWGLQGTQLFLSSVTQLFADHSISVIRSSRTGADKEGRHGLALPFLVSLSLSLSLCFLFWLPSLSAVI